MSHVWGHICYYIDPKFKNFFLFYYRIRFFLFSHLKFINGRYKKRKEEGKRFGHIWGPSSVP